MTERFRAGGASHLHPRVFTKFRSVQYQRPPDVVDLRDLQSLSRGRVRIIIDFRKQVSKISSMLTLPARKKGTSADVPQKLT